MPSRGALERAVGRAVRAAALAPADAAASELARTFARAIDGNPEMLPQVGRQFLETLAQLGLTPKARAAILKDGPTQAQQSGLDELRARREKRA